MRLPVFVRPEAAQDIEEAASWYEEQSRGLGREFLEEVDRSLQRIAEQPELRSGSVCLNSIPRLISGLRAGCR